VKKEQGLRKSVGTSWRSGSSRLGQKTNDQSGFAIGLVFAVAILVGGITAAFTFYNQGTASASSSTANQQASLLVQQAAIIQTAASRYSTSGTQVQAMEDLYKADLVSTSLTADPKTFQQGIENWKIGYVRFLSSGNVYKALILKGIKAELIDYINKKTITQIATNNNIWQELGVKKAKASERTMSFNNTFSAPPLSGPINLNIRQANMEQALQQDQFLAITHEDGLSYFITILP